MPEVPDDPGPGDHPTQDRDELHDIYRGWRAVADSYPGTRVLVGELWLADIDRFAKYLRPDELHTAFNFDFMARPWRADDLRASIDATLAAHAPVGAPATWVLSNHDVTRPVTRYGRADTSFAFRRKRFGVSHGRGPRTTGGPAPPPCSRRPCPGRSTSTRATSSASTRSRSPSTEIQDPMHDRSGGIDPGRDGCRVPLPWSGTAAPFGFSPDDADAPPVADPAGPLGRPDGRGRGGRPRLDAQPLSRRRSGSVATEPGLGDGPLPLARVRPGTSWPSPAAPNS